MGSYIYLMQILMWHHRPGYFLQSEKANICHVAPPSSPFLTASFWKSLSSVPCSEINSFTMGSGARISGAQRHLRFRLIFLVILSTKINRFGSFGTLSRFPRLLVRIFFITSAPLPLSLVRRVSHECSADSPVSVKLMNRRVCVQRISW